MSSNPSKRPSYAGLTTCLRCDRRFYSWDRRQNRLCLTCREYLDREPSDEESYAPPKRRQPPRDL
jgi:hypothetical protein